MCNLKSYTLLTIFLTYFHCSHKTKENENFPLEFLGAASISNLLNIENKFASMSTSTFYRKVGNYQYQDIVIEYNLKQKRGELDTVEAYIGDVDKISLYPSSLSVAHSLSNISDLFHEGYLRFSNFDLNKNFKVYLTYKREGKIISYLETITSHPSIPIIPPNSIILPSIYYETSRSITYSNGIASEYQLIRVKFQTGSDLSAFTKLEAYLGRPNIIHIASDNYNVEDYIIATHFDTTSSSFLFFTPELNSSYTILVVGSNSNAKGNISITTSPPPPPTSPCADARTAPTIIGNCNDHCLDIKLVGNQMEVQSKVTVPADTNEYLYLDLFSSTVSGGIGPIASSFMEQFSPIGIGTYQTNLRSFDVTTFTNECVVFSSYLAEDKPTGFKDNYISGKVFVP